METNSLASLFNFLFYKLGKSSFPDLTIVWLWKAIAILFKAFVNWKVLYFKTCPKLINVLCYTEVTPLLFFFFTETVYGVGGSSGDGGQSWDWTGAPPITSWSQVELGLSLSHSESQFPQMNYGIILRVWWDFEVKHHAGYPPFPLNIHNTFSALSPNWMISMNCAVWVPCAFQLLVG